MPDIKIAHVLSVSSEHKNHLASNLLKPDGGNKWVSSKSGEKQVSAILQLSKSCEIHSIHIGNENSAFVEIFVRKSSCASEDFKVLLVASAFMTPMESKSLKLGNKVRMFTKDMLAADVREEKWDVLKIVCTQPFNKNIEYGLSFIKFHSAPDPDQPPDDDTRSGASSLTDKKQKVGRFLVYDSDDDGGGGGDSAGDRAAVGKGSLFRKLHTNTPTSHTGNTGSSSSSSVSAAVRASDKQIDADIPVRAATVEPVKTAKPTAKPVKITAKPVKPTAEPVKPTAEPVKPTAEHGKADSKPDIEIKQPSSSQNNQGSGGDVSKLMRGVVFALSGFQNPYRGELRQRAIDMGAYYKPDWGKGCTHLICAFSNTPKFDQVSKLGGKIVRKEWVLDSYKQGRLMPWTEYDMTSGRSQRQPQRKRTPLRNDDDDSKSDDSRDDDDGNEDDDEDYDPRHDKPAHQPSPAKGGKRKRIIIDDDDDDTEDDDDDTDDEIERYKGVKRARQQENPMGEGAMGVGKGANDTGNRSFDESAAANSDDDGLPPLPDFYRDKHFLLYGEFGEDEQKQVIRYITAFNGTVSEYMSERVQYVVTNDEWDEHFDKALEDNSGIHFVKPKWVFECARRNCFLPHQPYVVVPK